MGLVHNPAGTETIREILAQNNRVSDEPLPEQMTPIFQSFFNGDN